MYNWDEDKRAANWAKHGVDFADAERFDWDTAIRYPDVRYNYGEVRMRATGYVGPRLHVLVYTERGRSVRVIGLRKANKREVMQWVKDQK